jgi:hypothetical protein
MKLLPNLQDQHVDTGRIHWKALWDFCMLLSPPLTLAVLSTHKSSA